MKLTSPRTLLVALLSLAGTGLLLSADTTSSLDSTDQKFISNAALSGKAELQIAQLAVKKGQNAEVQAIAALIVKDHTTVNTQISDLAKAKGLALTSAGNPDADTVVADLEKHQTGADFDRAYLAQAKKSHKASIAAYTEAASESKDIDVKTWAGLTVVALQGHLDRINNAIAAL